jgi:5,10-methylene-tetrahydrofolate dehydrogenase/methenyl tetrahydrofolate cyclohydrolase
MDEERILSTISLEKDVDGFHPLNVGNLALRGRNPLFVPCAAKACIELLLQSGIELMGKHVAVIGRSKVVGLPTSLLLQVKVVKNLSHIYEFYAFFAVLLYEDITLSLIFF